MNAEKQYIQAFNNGYILAEYSPDLLQIISENLPSTKYVESFKDGAEEFEYEKKLERLQNLSEIRYQVKKRGNDLNREI